MVREGLKEVGEGASCVAFETSTPYRGHTKCKAHKAEACLGLRCDKEAARVQERQA